MPLGPPCPDCDYSLIAHQLLIAGCHVAATGALFGADARDPVASLVRAQRLAVELAARRGINPHRPRDLSRSVILTGTAA